MEGLDFKQRTHISFIRLHRSPTNKRSDVVGKAVDAFSAKVEGWIYYRLCTYPPVAVIHCQSAKNLDIRLSKGLIFEVNMLVAASVDDKAKWNSANELSSAKRNWFGARLYQGLPIFGDLGILGVALDSLGRELKN